MEGYTRYRMDRAGKLLELQSPQSERIWKATAATGWIGLESFWSYRAPELKKQEKMDVPRRNKNPKREEH